MFVDSDLHEDLMSIMEEKSNEVEKLSNWEFLEACLGAATECCKGKGSKKHSRAPYDDLMVLAPKNDVICIISRYAHTTFGEDYERRSQLTWIPGGTEPVANDGSWS